MDKDNVYLKHILDAIRLISEFTKDMNKHTFARARLLFMQLYDSLRLLERQ